MFLYFKLNIFGIFFRNRENERNSEILHKPNKYIESKRHEGGGYKGGKMTKYYFNFESTLGGYKGLYGM